MELDGLCSYHELQGPEAQQELGEEEYGQHDVDGSIQGENDGVHIAKEVDGEGELEKCQQPETSKLCNLEIQH